MVDIDDTIAKSNNCIDLKNKYEQAQPIQERINKINKLYDEGNIIIYWTARGTLSQKPFFDLTLKQLQSWGCKFHELRMNKPVYDLFIDDKNINSEDFFKH